MTPRRPRPTPTHRAPRDSRRSACRQRTAGFCFLTWIPRALAAGLTLTGSALLSFGAFLVIQRLVHWWWMKRHTPSIEPAQVRNITFGIAAFSAFVTFYSFAGQPTLRKVEWLPT